MDSERMDNKKVNNKNGLLSVFRWALSTLCGGTIAICCIAAGYFASAETDGNKKKVTLRPSHDSSEEPERFESEDDEETEK